MRRTRNTGSDLLISVISYALAGAVCFCSLFPAWNILVISLNDAIDAVKGGIFFWPREFSLDSYRIILSDSKLGMAFLMSAMRTLIGTPLACLFTILPAYVLSKRNLWGWKFLNLYFIFTMYFSGGLIPYFMVIKTLGLYNNFLVYIIPSLFSVFNMILMRTYIEQLPAELEEAAKIDGAGAYRIVFRLTIPLSMPIIATVAIFVGIGQWNSWFDSFIFTTDSWLQTLMSFLVTILSEFETKAYTTQAEMLSRQMNARRVAVTPNSIRMATVIVAIVPILCIYPFVQKHFTKGIMIGAIKA